MTEQEWLQATDPMPMLEFLRGKASDRKLRLFAVGCCRHVWYIMPDEPCRQAAEVAERFADGMATEQELRAAADAAQISAEDNSFAKPHQSFAVGQGIYFAARTACYAANSPVHETAARAARTLYSAAIGAAGDPDTNLVTRRAAADAVRQYQINLLNDLFGNPFRPITINPAWLTWHGGLLVSMARRMYDSRDFADMPVLADALEEAGCQEQDILDHCRSGGEHVRGCWLVDLLLGKE
jgi:hypothetical protein